MLGAQERVFVPLEEHAVREGSRKVLGRFWKVLDEHAVREAERVEHLVHLLTAGRCEETPSQLPQRRRGEVSCGTARGRHLSGSRKVLGRF